jgi:hypothetical protein
VAINELAFGIDIGSVAQIGVHHGGVQHVALAVGQDYCLKNLMVGLPVRRGSLTLMTVLAP